MTETTQQSHDPAAEQSWTFPDIIDREGWPPGPWDDEPDKIEYRDPGTNAPVIIRRVVLGSLCGYVAVPPGHPWHGSNGFDCPAVVHGGVNYGGPCQEEWPDPEAYGYAVCHVAAPGESDDVWWLGFDCQHITDTVPQVSAILTRAGHGTDAPFGMRQTYKDVAFVRAQCAELARQAAAEALPMAPWERAKGRR